MIWFATIFARYFHTAAAAALFSGRHFDLNDIFTGAAAIAIGVAAFFISLALSLSTSSSPHWQCGLWLLIAATFLVLLDTLWSKLQREKRFNICLTNSLPS